MRYVTALPDHLRRQLSDPQFVPQEKLDDIEQFFLQQNAVVVRVVPGTALREQVDHQTKTPLDEARAPVILLVPRYGDLAHQDLEGALTLACAIARFQSDMARRINPVQVVPLYAT